jgi:hypothetical protein
MRLEHLKGNYPFGSSRNLRANPGLNPRRFILDKIAKYA